MEAYALRNQNTIDQYIATQPILDMCLTGERRPGAWVTRWWLEQEDIDLAGTMAVAAGPMGV